MTFYDFIKSIRRPSRAKPALLMPLKTSFPILGGTQLHFSHIGGILKPAETMGDRVQLLQASEIPLDATNVLWFPSEGLRCQKQKISVSMQCSRMDPTCTWKHKMQYLLA